MGQWSEIAKIIYPSVRAIITCVLLGGCGVVFSGKYDTFHEYLKSLHVEYPLTVQELLWFVGP